MVGWSRRYINPFKSIHEKWVGKNGRLIRPSRLYVPVSRVRAAVAWRAWATSAARGVAFRGSAAGLAAGAGYYAYKYFRSRIKSSPVMPRVRRYAGRKRRANGALVRSRRHRYQQDAGANYLQLTHSKDRGGRYLSAARKQYLIVKAHLNDQIERWQGCDDNADYGFFPLNFVNATGAPTFKDLPVYIVDLTSVCNVYYESAVSQVNVNPLVMYRLRADDNGKYSWVAQFGKINQDTTEVRGAWQIERTSRRVSPLTNGHDFSTYGDKAMIEWLDFRMLLYGARGRPSSVGFKIISFKDTDMVPSVGALKNDNTAITVDADSSNAPADPEAAKFHQFYMNLVTSLVGNPISKRGLKEYNFDRICKTHYAKTFDFQPIDNGEGDPTGHQVDFHYFHRVNKVFDYVTEPVAVTDDDKLIEADEFPVYTNVNRLSVCPDRKGRMFALITGVNIEASDGEASPGLKGPSFDFIVRRKLSVMRN